MRIALLEKQVAQLSLLGRQSYERVQKGEAQLRERDEELQQAQQAAARALGALKEGKEAREGQACELPDGAPLGFSSYFFALGWSLLNTTNRGMPEAEIVERLRLMAAMTGCKEEIPLPKLRHLKEMILAPDVYKLEGPSSMHNTVAMVSISRMMGKARTEQAR